eukprot:7619686-Alexandrium_andersonii.AAC.1
MDAFTCRTTNGIADGYSRPTGTDDAESCMVSISQPIVALVTHCCSNAPAASHMGLPTTSASPLSATSPSVSKPAAALSTASTWSDAPLLLGLGLRALG